MLDIQVRFNSSVISKLQFVSIGTRRNSERVKGLAQNSHQNYGCVGVSYHKMYVLEAMIYDNFYKYVSSSKFHSVG